MSDKWKRELEQIAAGQFRPSIRFSASIRLPLTGHFNFQAEYEKNPEKFLTAWLEGAVSNLYTGPLIDERTDCRGEFTGHLLALPKVQVKHFPPK